MVGVRVIIVTHGNPRPTGRETAPRGDSEEKGLACSASAGYALALPAMDENRDTRTRECERVPLHTLTH